MVNIRGFKTIFLQVNQLLHKDLKNYLRCAACSPQKIDFNVFNRIPVELKPHEICHMILLVFGISFLE